MTAIKNRLCSGFNINVQSRDVNSLITDQLPIKNLNINIVYFLVAINRLLNW